MIPSSDIATRPCSSDLLTTDFPEIFSQLWLSSEACTKYYPLERGRVGAATVEPPWAVCVLGRVSRSPQANATSKLAVWGRIQHKQAVSACWLSHRWALNKAQCGCPSRPCNAVFQESTGPAGSWGSAGRPPGPRAPTAGPALPWAPDAQADGQSPRTPQVGRRLGEGRGC